MSAFDGPTQIWLKKNAGAEMRDRVDFSGVTECPTCLRRVRYADEEDARTHLRALCPLTRSSNVLPCPMAVNHSHAESAA